MESPFLHFPNLEVEKTERPLPVVRETIAETPFLNIAKLNGKQDGYNPRAETFVTMMNELHSDEFNEQMEDMLNEIKEVRSRYASSEEYGSNEQYTSQLVRSYYQPVINEVNGLFDTLVQKGYEVDKNQTNLEHVENFLSEYEFKTPDLTSVQENFLGGLTKWAKKAVSAVKSGISKVGALAAKFGLGFFFNKLKGIAKKFLMGFLEKGKHLLPEKYRGLADTLAAKVLPASVLQPPATTELPEDMSTRETAEQAQDGMNAATAHLLTAANELEWGATETELSQSEGEDISDTANEVLADARERFVSQLGELPNGASPQPAVENFLPVVLTALRFVIPIIGRERVINWLVPLLAKLIEQFVGKDNATTLSRLMVDKGFRMLNLETRNNYDDHTAGAQAVAATVENTIRQVPDFPAYVMKDRQLFERYVVQAFEKSAAAYLPDVLSDRAYSNRPDLRESNERSVVWKDDMEFEEDHDAAYKRLNEVIETELNPYIASEIKTFGGIPLSVFLRDRMGIHVTGTLPVRVHLFEPGPGNDLFQIAKSARYIRGLGSGARYAWMQLHPLTPVAAGLLMREPGLGCKRHIDECLSKRKHVKGHRYYYLEIDGARPQLFFTVRGKQVLRHHTCLKTKVNFPAGQVLLNLYLGEHDAQAIAVGLRKNQPESAHVLTMMAMKPGLKNIFSHGKYDYLKIVHTHVQPGSKSGLAIDRIPPVLANAFSDALTNWAGKALIDYLRSKSADFIKAADDHSDGVTVQVSIMNPPGFEALKGILAGDFSGLQDNPFNGQPGEISIITKPGYDQR